jgi:hypothetical protein
LSFNPTPQNSWKNALGILIIRFFNRQEELSGTKEEDTRQDDSHSPLKSSLLNQLKNDNLSKKTKGKRD